MKKYTFMVIGALIVMLSFGGMAYAAGEEGGMGAGQDGSGQVMEKVDINTATVEELQSLPGMDQELAQNIIDYREANGPFGSVEELISVEGIDNEKLDALREQITVGELQETQPMEPSAPMEPEQPMGEPMPGESPSTGY
ncbi:MAG TPA: helix-hairpin-helix domain-containing protein [Desulfomonilia bacterium]|mgnify:FL=1|jgi:comEA protein|nr:helix-hairpin-helix domain-containing protein [Pseudomonadota bacterium]HOE73080.1 helix-hairpin-helix domain-containing protein [Deltaproteobacteria bacterium]HRR21363.1 helix-hairpin-helix domain-containing protein [Desulfomonilia bacterium]HOS26914.1 helix-hairpin-helix domain-containing protein [Deltaproteobacteria bacterium]HPL87193.1 helix-hairpin-helix domain-containing protein [Deltaproteobacteria bacterium]